LPGYTVELLDAHDYPEETGDTFAENARAKALYGRSVAAGGSWLLGEDSGLEVLADADDRRARYVCELVALAPDGRELRGTGTLEGHIAREPRGTAGFGFDPVFVPDGEEQTVAELGDAWKAERSHRARAARALLAQLG